MFQWKIQILFDGRVSKEYVKHVLESTQVLWSLLAVSCSERGSVSEELAAYNSKEGRSLDAGGPAAWNPSFISDMEAE